MMLFSIKQFALFYKRHNLYIINRLIVTNKWFKTKMFDINIPYRSDPIIRTLDTPEFKSIFTTELITLANIFKKYNYDLRLVGGAVRDILMNINPKDLDFATNATPDQMKEFFNKEEIRMINVNGEKHGTVTTRINNKQNFEITTLRVDVATNGRHADVVFTTAWILDASRRDLTINSMFLDLDGRVYDYFYGYEDLMNKRIAFVGNPSLRICEDFLRIFRYFRFYGRVSDVPNNHNDEIIKSIKDNVSGIEIISGERIWSEWTKIFEGNFYRELTIKMLECGCGKYMGLPENINYEEFDRVCLNAQKNNIKLRPISYVSALLNNEDDVLQLFMRLRLTRYDRNIALFITHHRNNKIDENSLKLHKKLVLKSINKPSDIKEYTCELFKYKGALNLVEEFQNWNLIFPVSGSAILPLVDDKRFVQIILSRLKDIWVDNNCEILTDELMIYVPEIVEKAKKEIEETGQSIEEIYNSEKWNEIKSKKKYGKRKLLY